MANPPVVIGALTDVPAPGSAIASQWSQEVTLQSVHKFASIAAIKAWTTAPTGTYATAPAILARSVGAGVWAIDNRQSVIAKTTGADGFFTVSAGDLGLAKISAAVLTVGAVWGSPTQIDGLCLTELVAANGLTVRGVVFRWTNGPWIILPNTPVNVTVVHSGQL